MKRGTIRIVYQGRRAAIRKLLAELLVDAGYDVSSEPHDGKARSSDLVIREDGAGDGAPADGVVLVGRTPVPRSGRTPIPETGRTMNLQQLREHARKTQGDVARRASVSQPQLSRIEGRRDHLVSTLRKYVRAMGGELRVVADIGAETVVLRDV